MQCDHIQWDQMPSDHMQFNAANLLCEFQLNFSCWRQSKQNPFFGHIDLNQIAFLHSGALTLKDSREFREFLVEKVNESNFRTSTRFFTRLLLKKLKSFKKNRSTTSYFVYVCKSNQACQCIYGSWFTTRFTKILSEHSVCYTLLTSLDQKMQISAFFY